MITRSQRSGRSSITRKCRWGPRTPIPDNKARVETTQSNLSWTNPDPNDGVSPITCTVYFGADPNFPEMDWVTLAPGASSVDLTAANFPRFVPLVNDRQYFWAVNCKDPSMDPGDDTITGVMWSFFTDNNEPPTVNAGDDQVVWLGKSGTAGQEVVSLAGTATDDGQPVPPAIDPAVDAGGNGDTDCGHYAGQSSGRNGNDHGAGHL